MEPVLTCINTTHSPLYDRRLMIFILKKHNGRRSFSENCKFSKIKEERRYRQHEPRQKDTQESQENTADKKSQETNTLFRFKTSVEITE